MASCAGWLAGELGLWKADQALCLQLSCPLPPNILTTLLSTPRLWESQVLQGTNNQPRAVTPIEI